VVDHWIECASIPPEDPQHQVEFFHRQMNEEVDSLECSAQTLVDFPDVDWDMRLRLARQCWDEARHAAMFRRVFLARGGHIGQYPILNFQFRIIARIPTLVGRLAVQNRSFEAGGLDAIAFGIGEAHQRGDDDLAEMFEAQQADEITHVRMANDYVRAATQRDPRTVLQMGVAMTAASKAFFQVMGPEGTDGVGYPADVSGRREAGFSDSEVRRSIGLQDAGRG
jgi:uncharacterized ferritin-like protein (DUF455 family)